MFHPTIIISLLVLTSCGVLLTNAKLSPKTYIEVSEDKKKPDRSPVKTPTKQSDSNSDDEKVPSSPARTPTMLKPNKATLTPVTTSLPTYYMFTHGPPGGNSFFDQIELGAKHAAAQLNGNINFVYKNVGFDNGPAQAAAIKAAVDSGAAGIATTLPNKNALLDSLVYAYNHSVPVILFNSGIKEFKSVHALTGYGSNEDLAGDEAGKLLKNAGGKTMLCVETEIQNIGLDQRCNSAKLAFQPGETIIVIYGNSSSLNKQVNDMLSQNPSIDTYLATTNDALVAYDLWLSSSSITRKMYAGSFDFSSLVVQMLQTHKLLFTISQQPYQQGYYPVLGLNVWNTMREVLGGGDVVLTGPIAKF